MEKLTSKAGLPRRLALPVLALLATLALMVYVGYRDVERAYSRLELDRVAAQAETVQNAMAPFALAGLPLGQFPGFEPLTTPILESDPSLAAIVVADVRQETLFVNTRPELRELVSVPPDAFQPSKLPDQDQRYAVAETAGMYRVSVELNNKFETVGQVHVFVPRTLVSSKILRGFWPVAVAAALLLAAYATGLALLGRRGRAGLQTVLLGYGVAVGVLVAVLLLTLVNLYGDGVQARTRGLAVSLANRLSVPGELGVEASELTGLDEALRDYRRLNPDLSFIAVTGGGQIVAHTEPGQAGTPWSDPTGDDVLAVEIPGGDRLALRLGVPKGLVLQKVRGHVQDFALTLLGAGLLFALLFAALRSRRVMTYLPQVVPKVAVLAVSLLLLAYVGYGEAFRTFPSFQVDSLAAHAESVESSMEPFLLSGLPLGQIPGFETTTAPIIQADPAIAAILVADEAGEIVFSSAAATAARLPVRRTTGFEPSPLTRASTPYRVTESEQFYRVSLDLRNKFEKVGELHVLTPKAHVADRLAASFRLVPLALVALVLAFGLAVFVIVRRRIYETRPLAIAYALAFSAMAAVVVVTLVNTYSEGVQARAKAVASSLGHRLSAPLELGLEVTELDGLDAALNNYLRQNPDLSFVALSADEKIAVHTSESLVGARWQAPGSDFVYDYELVPRASASDPRLMVHVGIPRALILEKLWRSVKNFFVLFVACGFIAMVLFNLMRALRAHADRVPGQEVSRAEVGAQLVQTFLFASVFVEGLSASFLSTYFTSIGRQSGASPALVSAIFTVYFLTIALSLVPAGRLAERGWMKPLMVVGAGLTAASLLAMATTTSFLLVFALRAAAGFGQGLLAVGVQSYSMEVTAGRKQTQGAAAVVFGSGAGLVSGIAIGALLTVYVGPRGVFGLGGIVNLLLVPYAALLIPAVALSEEGRARLQQSEGLIRNFVRAVRDAEFIKTMLLIGMPAKAVLTGVVLFAVPLVLNQQKYAPEDIGQIVLLYSAGILMITPYVARYVDRTGRTTPVLVAGALTSGLGMLMIGLIGWDLIVTSLAPWVGTTILILGMIVLGFGHGIIGAPLITHVTSTTAAKALGRASAASVYRFFERFGNVGGPLIAAQLLALTQGGALSIAWVGIVTIVFGAAFVVHLAGRRVAPAPTG